MLSKNKMKFLRSLEKKKQRQAEGVFLAEGHKTVDDLLATMSCVYAAALPEWIENNASAIRRAGFPVDAVTPDELRKVSLLEHPQDVVAVFRIPHEEVDGARIVASSLCLALDDVQNPGNLGTIIRLADWFGIGHIFCSPSTADAYNPKTIQATMGAIARVGIHECDLVELIRSLPDQTPVYGTFLDGDNIYGKRLQQHGLIVMGNEGNGISDRVGGLVTDRLLIPNYPAGRTTSESLNVSIATAIVCGEFRRQALSPR